jgi:hypothetical protein
MFILLEYYLLYCLPGWDTGKRRVGLLYRSQLITGKSLVSNFVLVNPKPSQPTTTKPKPPAITKSQRDYILLDRSGSMAKHWDEALTALNAYVLELSDARIPTRVTFAVFDHEYLIVKQDSAPKDWARSIGIKPGGGTALNDAIGRLVAQARDDNPQQAAIVIITDGEENASRELTEQDAKRLLDDCRSRGWQVIFIGLGHDNASQGQAYGAKPEQTVAAGKAGIAATMRKTAQKRTVNVQTGAAMTFTPAEKQEAKKTLLIGKR